MHLGLILICIFLAQSLPNEIDLPQTGDQRQIWINSFMPGVGCDLNDTLNQTKANGYEVYVTRKAFEYFNRSMDEYYFVCLPIINDPAQRYNSSLVFTLTTKTIKSSRIKINHNFTQPTLKSGISLVGIYHRIPWLVIAGWKLDGFLWLVGLSVVLAFLLQVFEDHSFHVFVFWSDIVVSFFYFTESHFKSFSSKIIKFMATFIALIVTTIYIMNLINAYDSERTFDGKTKPGGLYRKFVYTHLAYKDLFMNNVMLPLTFDLASVDDIRNLFLNGTVNSFAYDREIVDGLVDKICDLYVIKENIMKFYFGGVYGWMMTYEQQHEWNTALLYAQENILDTDLFKMLNHDPTVNMTKCQNKKTLNLLTYRIIDFYELWIVYAVGIVISSFWTVLMTVYYCLKKENIISNGIRTQTDEKLIKKFKRTADINCCPAIQMFRLFTTERQITFLSSFLLKRLKKDDDFSEKCVMAFITIKQRYEIPYLKIDKKEEFQIESDLPGLKLSSKINTIRHILKLKNNKKKEQPNMLKDNNIGRALHLLNGSTHSSPSSINNSFGKLSPRRASRLQSVHPSLVEPTKKQRTKDYESMRNIIDQFLLDAFFETICSHYLLQKNTFPFIKKIQDASNANQRIEIFFILLDKPYELDHSDYVKIQLTCLKYANEYLKGILLAAVGVSSKEVQKILTENYNGVLKTNFSMEAYWEMLKIKLKIKALMKKKLKYTFHKEYNKIICSNMPTENIIQKKMIPFSKSTFLHCQAVYFALRKVPLQKLKLLPSKSRLTAEYNKNLKITVEVIHSKEKEDKEKINTLTREFKTTALCDHHVLKNHEQSIFVGCCRQIKSKPQYFNLILLFVNKLFIFKLIQIFEKLNLVQFITSKNYQLLLKIDSKFNRYFIFGIEQLDPIKLQDSIESIYWHFGTVRCSQISYLLSAINYLFIVIRKHLLYDLALVNYNFDWQID